MIRPLLTLILCSLLSHAALAEEQQTATVLQKTTLLDAPFSDASPVTTLKAKQQVTVVQRKGGWYQVSKGEHQGWLRMSRVRFGDGKTAQANGKGLGQVFSFFSTGRSGADGVTVATGIRGLDAADVSNATPDHEALKRLEQFRSQPKQAKKFAQSAQLKSQPLGYFDKQ